MEKTFNQTLFQEVTDSSVEQALWKLVSSGNQDPLIMKIRNSRQKGKPHTTRDVAIRDIVRLMSGPKVPRSLIADRTDLVKQLLENETDGKNLVHSVVTRIRNWNAPGTPISATTISAINIILTLGGRNG